MTLTLLLLIIPVIGSIVGLIGKSWDDTKTSRVKLTLRGWTSFAIIIIGLAFAGYKTIETQNENDKLKEQRNNVRELVYNKLFFGCISSIRPLIIIYYENAPKYRQERMDYYSICIEMMSDSAEKIFKDCNLLDSVKGGTEFDSWDKSYADYINGYYNSKYSGSIEEITTRWANYIDMEDLILIDTIANDNYWTTLENICNPNLRSKDLTEFNFYDNDDDIFIEQKELLRHICTLLKKAKNTSHNKSIANSGAGR